MGCCWMFQLMLDSWNECIFHNIKYRLQDSAMKLVHAERNGEAFDSQLVIGVRESYGVLWCHSVTLCMIIDVFQFCGVSFCIVSVCKSNTK